MVNVLNFGAEAFNLLAEGFEQRIQRLLAVLREGLALGLEDLPRELLEFQLELAAALLEQLLLFDEMLLLLLQGAAQGGVLPGQVGEPLLQHLMTVLLALAGLFEFVMLLQQLCMLGPCGTGLILRFRQFGT
ncbi:hypothetical protein D9M68_751630 [compost metagenome]